MGMLDNGMNAIRDFWSTRITEFAIGTGTNQETMSDTALQTALGVVSSENTNTKTDRKVTATGVVYTTQAESETVSEAVWQDSSDNAMSRVTFTGVSKGTDSEIIIETRWYFRQLYGDSS